MSDAPDPLTPDPDPLAPDPDPLDPDNPSYLERKAAHIVVGLTESELDSTYRLGTPERLEGDLALSDLDREVARFGEHHFSLSPHIDPRAIDDLLDNHPSASDSDKEAAKSGTSSHYLSLELSNMTWGEFQSRVGRSSFLSDAEVSLTPAQSSHPLQLGIHADLIKQNWPDIGGLQMTTDLQGTLTYTDRKGVSGSLELRQDVKFKTLTLEAVITTDIPTGSMTFVGALKFEF